MAIRAVIYGVGAMGGEVAALLLERGVPVVGAIARSPQKVGRDLGEVIGLDRDTGVIVSDDADAVLRDSGANIAVLTTNSYLADHAPFIERCVRAGLNVITIAEEALHPWRTSPGEAARLDALAREHGVSIFGGGHEDAFWIGLGAQLAGAAHRVDAIRWESTWNPEAAGPELMASLGIGDPGSGESATVTWREDDPRPPFGLPALDALAEHLGLPDAPRTVTSEQIVAERPVPSSALGRDIAIGEIIGVRDTIRREPVAAGEPLLEFTVTGRLNPEQHASGETWEIEGVPSMRMRTEFSKGHYQVTAQVANRLEDVVAAEPGWVLHSEMPAIGYPAPVTGR